MLEVKRMKLIGYFCLHIACKYQEIYYPHIQVFLSDEFTFEDYIHIEEKLLHHLEFNIQVPFDLSYIIILQKFFGFDDEKKNEILIKIKKGLSTNILRKYDIKEIIFGFISNLEGESWNEKFSLATEIFSVESRNCKQNYKKFTDELNSYANILELKKFDLDIKFLH